MIQTTIQMSRLFLDRPLVAFSCKRRGFCPSCGARRMSETAAHLVDWVLPMKNIRQWVISFPIPIRLYLAVRPKVMARALEITHAVIAKFYGKKVGTPKAKAKTGAVTLIQRFGGSLNPPVSGKMSCELNLNIGGEILSKHALFARS